MRRSLIQTNMRHKPPRTLGQPRGPEEIRMTLIAAFRTSEGVVICADSQETLGNPTIYGDMIIAALLISYSRKLR